MNRPIRLSKKYGLEGPCYRSRGLPLVFVDLGKRKVGWAVFRDEELAACATTSIPNGVLWDAELVAMLVVDAIRRVPGGGAPRTLDWVCEWPVLRQNFRVALKDIEDLQEVGRLLGTIHGGWKEKYRPSEWKGTIPKPVHHNRVAALLSPSELALCPARSQHDTWDAVAGGLYAVGRCGVAGAS